MDASYGKTHQWMITRGTPISGNLHRLQTCSMGLQGYKPRLSVVGPCGDIHGDGRSIPQQGHQASHVASKRKSQRLLWLHWSTEVVIYINHKIMIYIYIFYYIYNTYNYIYMHISSLIISKKNLRERMGNRSATWWRHGDMLWGPLSWPPKDPWSVAFETPKKWW